MIVDEVPLEDLVADHSISYGIVQPGTDGESGVPIVRVGDLESGVLDSIQPQMRVDPAIEERFRKTRLRGGEVLVSLVGTAGRAAVVPASLAGWNVARAVGVLRPAGVEPEWLVYALRAPSCQIQISAALNTTVQATLNLADLKRVRIPMPPASTRRAIAEVLGALDDKIAANGTVCATASDLMVALAARLATEPPVLLADLAASVKTQVTPTEMGEVRHYSLPAFDAGQLPASDSGSTILSAKLRVRQPSVLLSRLNPRIPRVWDIPRLPDQPAVASTEFLVLEPKSISTGVLWAVLSQPSTLSRLQELARGTSGSHQRVKPDDAMSLQVPDPRRLTEGQTKTIAELSLRRHAAKLESVELATLRDTLLPHLMSGRITVRDAEKQVEEVL